MSEQLNFKETPEFKIIGLQIDGIKKLKAIEMKPEESGLIQIKGKNKQGKTSILDALEILIRGNKFVTHDMIQHGKDKAEIIGKIGEYTIKRVITESSNRLEIVNKEGFQMAIKPQAFLDTLINELTFNPRPFLDKKPEEKLKFMMDLLKIDFTEIDNQLTETEQERLYLGREIKSIGKPIPVDKAEKIDITRLINFNKEQTEKRVTIDKAKDIVKLLQEKEKDYLEKISELQKELEQTKQRIENGKKYLSELPQPEKEKDLSSVQKQNEQADAYLRYLEHQKQYDKKQSAYEQLNEKITILRESKKKKLAETKMPISGLEIRENGLYYNNIFCENWSDSEGDLISRELCIAMNPKLKAMFIDRGETYDSDSLKELEIWAKEKNIQAFITIVDDIPEKHEPGVFYIEDGSLIKD